MPDFEPVPAVPSTTLTILDAAALLAELKKFFLGFCTLHREIAPYDYLYKLVLGDATFYIRLQKKEPRSGVSCIGIEIGTDADALQASTQDPEACWPFDVSGPDSASLTMSWDTLGQVIRLRMLKSMDAVYQWEYALKLKETYAFQQSYHRPGSAPNFKATSTPYLKLGAG